MFTIVQIVLLTALMFFFQYDVANTQVTTYGTPVLAGLVSGFIMGDVTMGLLIGGTMQLMSLGVGGYGGSSVPNYQIGAIIGVAFAVAVGGGLESGLAVGIPTAALGVQLDVIGKMVGSFFLHKAQESGQKLETKKMYRWVLAGFLGRPLMAALVVFIALTAGASVIEMLLANMPVWLNGGLSVAGGLLPAVGFAILLKYMPFNKYYIYAILGFVLASYFNAPMLAVALIGFVAAVLTFKQTERFNNVSASGVRGGNNYDE